MSKILIRNFGPVKSGYKSTDGWMDIRKVTVFIGNQGSGKSTVAKLIATFSWIEKALVRGELKERDAVRDGYLINRCKYQNIEDYFKENTHIEYSGNAMHYVYREGKSFINWTDNSQYFLPKIMYVPAERNFISAVRNIRNLKGLPGTIYTFSDEFIKAAENLRDMVELPINNVRFEYQRLNQSPSIVGTDYKLRLSRASSGFQSLVPLFIVTKYLTEIIINPNNIEENNEVSLKEEQKIRQEIDRIMSNPNLSGPVKDIYLERLSSRFRYSSFLNIVEEPEQNLFPTSQQQILYSLLHYNNLHDHNGLVMTTHSPYLINYLTLAVKADFLKKNIKHQQQLKELELIVPLSSTIKEGDLAIYELDELNGTITELESYKGMPSDENKLNEELGESNELYARLLELQQGI
ncbi:ATP-binding protein [Mucilaginibacter sp. cycad4]|uniref:ATP-binding protein n=1 Tax=Mucilaginibacter sp. cycad4 TaxID=3342096 RepID=UPI002AABC6CE|nr:ATP-binding protein [Mucilaginibacter gossypii]WPU99023.1 ATP-binding protein [Mucilaginibacter gossypii]